MNLSELDALIRPVIQCANIARQARDALPVQAWALVPPMIRTPIDALFIAVETYERAVGRLLDAGVIVRANRADVVRE